MWVRVGSRRRALNDIFRLEISIQFRWYSAGRNDGDTLGFVLQNEQSFSPCRNRSDMVTSSDLTSSTHGEEACPL